MIAAGNFKGSFTSGASNLDYLSFIVKNLFIISVKYTGEIIASPISLKL